MMVAPRYSILGLVAQLPSHPTATSIPVKKARLCSHARAGRAGNVHAGSTAACHTASPPHAPALPVVGRQLQAAPNRHNLLASPHAVPVRSNFHSVCSSTEGTCESVVRPEGAANGRPEEGRRQSEREGEAGRQVTGSGRQAGSATASVACVTGRAGSLSLPWCREQLRSISIST